MALLPNVISVWEFDADLTDEVGSNDGTAYNGAARDTATKLLGAASLAVDGTNDYVKTGVTGIPDADEAQSWACWARYTSTPTGNQNLMSAGTVGSACQFGFREWWDPEDPEQMEPLEIACAWNYGGNILAKTTSLPSTSAWHHYCYTFDGTTHRFYVDGSLVDSSTESAQTGTPVGIGIGAWQAGAEYFGGHIDQAAVWGRALSADDVAALYNSGSGVAYADWDVTPETPSAVAVALGSGLAVGVGLRSAVASGVAGGSGLAAAVGAATYRAFGAAVGGLLATAVEATGVPTVHQAFGAAGGSGLAAVEAGSWGARPPTGTDSFSLSLREVAEFTGYGYLTSLAVVDGTCYVGCEHGEAPLYTVDGDGFTAVELPLDDDATLGYVQALLVDDDDGSLWAFGWQHGFDGVLDDPFALVEQPVGSGNWMTRLASLTGSGGAQGALTPTVWHLPDGGSWTLVATGPEEGSLLSWAQPVATDDGLACGLYRLTSAKPVAREGWRGLVADGSIEQVETSVHVAALVVVAGKLAWVRRSPTSGGWSFTVPGAVTPYLHEGHVTTLARPDWWPPQALVPWLGRGWFTNVTSGVQRLHNFVASSRPGPWWQVDAHGRYDVLTTWRGRLVMFGADDDGGSVWGCWDPPRMVLGRSAGDWRVRQARDFAGDLWCLGTQEHAIFGETHVGRQAVLVAGGWLRADSLTIEWGDGAGENTPSLTSVALEWAREHPTALALKSLAVQWGDGSGAHTPLLRRLTAQWGDNHALNQPTLTSVEVVWGKGGDRRPTLTGLTAEWGDGLGAAQPTLTSLGVQWRVGAANIKRPRLTSLTVEHGDGSGDNTPSLTSLALQWGDGLAAAQPTLTSCGLQWSIGYTRGRPTLTGLEAQWADTGPMPPRSSVALVSLAAEWADGDPIGDGDAVLWVTKTLTADCVGVRVVTPLSPARAAALECLIRCDREDRAVDDWDSYQRFGAHRTAVVLAPGREVRVGIVGPAIFDRPDVYVQFHVDE